MPLTFWAMMSAALERTRDRHVGLTPADHEDLPRFIDRINDEWVTAARRISPRLLIDALHWSGAQITSLWSSLDPEDRGEPVSWAGQEAAPVWLDAARDLTEYWVHHQQIREALSLPVALDVAPVDTVIDTFLRALPHTLREQQAAPGTRFTFIVRGKCGGFWTVERGVDGWAFAPAAPPAQNSVTVDVDTAWRLCTRLIQPGVAMDRASMTGATPLGKAALSILSIIRTE